MKFEMNGQGNSYDLMILMTRVRTMAFNWSIFVSQW